MGKNSEQRKIEAQLRAQQLIQKQGPANPNWRNLFYKFWQEIKSREAGMLALEHKMVIYSRQLETEKDEAVKEDLKAALKQGEIQQDINRTDLAYFQDEIIKHLGQEWTVKKVLAYLDEYQKEKDLLFKESEK